MCPLLFLALGCVNPQVSQNEYNLARTAYSAAKESEAKRYSPKYFYKAKGYLRRAKRAYDERYYDKATELFRKARYYSEKAENVSRLKQFKQGEMSP